MAIAVICPGCETDYSVPENLLGKTIRCKKCGDTIAVKAAKASRPAARVSADDEDDDRPRRSERRRYEDDEDEYEAPAKKGGVSPILIGGLALLLLGGGAAGVYFAFGDSTTEVVKNDPPPVRRDVRPERGPDTDPKANEEKKADDNKAAESKATEPKGDDKKAEEKKPDDAKATEKTATNNKADDKKGTTKKDPPKLSTPAAPPVQDTQSPTGIISYNDYIQGNMPGMIQEKVKLSTAMIDVGGGTGSGWFGFADGIVITNAHVLDMLGRDSKPPKKINIILNCGLPNERIIPHQNIKILAVDPKIDLAVMQVINEKDLPAPLKVRDAEELKESQRLRIFGFPLGNSANQEAGGTSKKATMAVRPTTVTAFRRNEFGQLFTVMLEGGMTNGNSGGPIVDAEGHVVCVVVRGYINRGFRMREQLLGSGIPSEWVTGLIAGRLNELTYGEPYKAGDKVRVPVKAKMLDPLNRVSKVGVRHWIGNNTDKPRPPGVEPAKSIEGDLEHKETFLTYDPKTKTATGEIEFDALSIPKTAYWGQLFYVTAARPKFHEPAHRLDLDRIPAERVPALLAAKPREGEVRTLTLTEKSFLQIAEENDPDGRPDQETETSITMKETILKADPQDTVSIARMRLDYEKAALKAIISGSVIEYPAQIAKIINDNVKKIQAAGWINKAGEVYKTKTNLLNLTNQNPNLIGRLQQMSDGALESLQFCSIPMPNEEKKPGDTWTGEKAMAIPYGVEHPPNTPRGPGGQPIPTAGGPPPKLIYARFVINTTYKYIGIREKSGHREAVIEIDGVVNPVKGKKADSSKGTIRGRATVDLKTGSVLSAELDLDYDTDISGEGTRRKLVGNGVYKLTRSSPSN